jgi:transposase, IS605 OrfB family, central region
MATVMRTYEYKLYNSKRNKHLHSAIDVASEVWNYSIAMHRRYYKLFGKHLPATRLMKHITRVKKREKYAHWKMLGSQAIQDVVQRVDRSYQAFFAHHKKKHVGKKERKSPPKFRRRKRYNSFTLKQAGYSFGAGNCVTIMGKDYKYVNHRPFNGEIKTVTVKRTKAGELFIFVTCKEEMNQVLSRMGSSIGMDFGLKHFLTLSDGSVIDSPQWYKHSLKAVRSANKHLSRCKKGSNNRKQALLHLEQVHRRIRNQRKDWFFKLSYQLVGQYATICIEDLNISAMKKLWGRKVSDYAFAEFVKILEWVAFRNGTTVVKIDRFAPSSKACHVCGTVNKGLSLKDREWTCDSCHTHHDRDVNAAINIQMLGQKKLAA